MKEDKLTRKVRIPFIRGPYTFVVSYLCESVAGPR